jgi:hippurate hydrolase
MASTPKIQPANERHGATTAVVDQAKGTLEYAREIRRDLHTWPEIGLDLPKTRDRVLTALEGLPLDITLHKTTSGIAALLTGDKPGPTVMLRGDMDALPMPEDTGLEFSSRVENAMHACGHDTHVGMLAGAARMLSERKADLPGRVLFMFQPGEEGYGGAEYMLDEGLLDVPKHADGSASPITAAYAIHITSSMPAGFLGTKGGPIMASSDRLDIIITGKGGHASEPFRTLDPVPVASEIVLALQALVTRRHDIFDPTVVTITRMIAGTAYNVIPETARLEGTIRAVSAATRAKVHEGIRRVAEGIAESIVGPTQVAKFPNPVMGAEDFSYVLEKLPGAMLFLGGTPNGVDPRKAPPNHSNRVDSEEDAMTTGMALYTSLALRSLGVMLN